MTESGSRYLYLLMALVALFILGPVERMMGMSFPLDALLFLVTIVLMLRSLLRRRRWLIISSVAAVIAFFITINVNPDGESSALGVVGCLLYIILIAGCIITMLGHLINERHIHKDTLIGGICVYFLLGHLWMLLYMMIQIFDPQAFHMASVDRLRLGDLQYYSFTVLSTLGYGDITPVNPLARNLGSLQVITGQLFLAIFMARLIGLYITQERSVRSGTE